MKLLPLLLVSQLCPMISLSFFSVFWVCSSGCKLESSELCWFYASYMSLVWVVGLSGVQVAGYLSVCLVCVRSIVAHYGLLRTVYLSLS